MKKIIQFTNKYSLRIPAVGGMKFSCSLAFAVLLQFSGIAGGADRIYDFEGLTSGQSLFGQDGWLMHTSPTWTGDIQIATGTGVNTTDVANGVTPGVAAGGYRTNDAQFSFLPFQGTETNAIMEGDFRLGTSSVGTVYFALSYDTNGSAAGGYFGGQRIGIEVTSGFVIRPADGSTISRTLATANGGNPAGVTTDWFRLRLDIDFTANGGDGAGSLSYMNLTNSETTFTPITGLQGIDLKLATVGSDPATWDTMFVRVQHGSEIDNLLPTNVRKPSLTINKRNAPTSRQRMNVKIRGRKSAKFFLFARNDGAVADSIELTSNKPKKSHYKYKLIQQTGGSGNITAAVSGSGKTFELVPAGSTVRCLAKLKGKKKRGRHTLRYTLTSPDPPVMKSTSTAKIIAKP